MNDASADRAGSLGRQLEAAGVGLVAVTFVDNAGITRVKCVPMRRIAAAASGGIGASTVFGVFTGYDGMAQSKHYGIPTGDLRLHPDTAALRHGEDAWAWAPADQRSQEGEDWPLDPRGFLRRMVARAASRGLSLRMGFELEWFAGADADAAVNRGPAYGAAALAACTDYVEAMVRKLSEYGVGIEQFHPEYSAGQLEVALAPADPVTAADENVLSRWLLHRVGHPLGIRTSFAPIVRSDLIGNGCHIHFSPWRNGDNMFGVDPHDPYGLALEGRAFLAGVLDALPALVGIGCAGPVSFLRLKPTRWVGAYRCWGLENREAPLRLIRGTRASRPHAANAELKCLDASGNPYLVAGAVIAAGLDGIDRALTLPPEVKVDPASLDDSARAAVGATPLPTTLEAAATELERSTVLSDALGEDLHAAIVAVRRAEAAAAVGKDETALISAYRWRY